MVNDGKLFCMVNDGKLKSVNCCEMLMQVCFLLILLMQEGAFLASLGMQCQTGSCVYNSSHPAPPGPPAPPSPPPLPPHEHHDVAAEVITLIGIGMVVSLGIVLGGFLIYQDSRLSQKRYKVWSEGVCIFDNNPSEEMNIRVFIRCAYIWHL